MYSIAELETVVCDSEDRAMSLVKNMKKTPSLRRLIIMEALSEELVAEGRAVGVDVKSFSYVEVRFSIWHFLVKCFDSDTRGFIECLKKQFTGGETKRREALDSY